MWMWCWRRRRRSGFFKCADGIRAGSVLIVVPDEYENGKLLMKNMDTREQASVKIEDLTEWANKID